MVENETVLEIKRHRTDNGGEYVDRFKKFFYEHKIRRERTMLGTPQHNGVVEHMNQKLTERAKSLHVQSSLPNVFWVETINMSTYLINQGPSVPLEHGIPEKIWSGKEVKLTHLRVFGCVAYINDQGRNKLDPKSKKCTFIGYGENEFGYHLWDNENQKMICSRDLIFNERVMYRDRNDTHTSNPEKSGPIYVEVDDVPKTPIVESPQLEESTEHSSDNNLIDQNLLLQVLY